MLLPETVRIFLFRTTKSLGGLTVSALGIWLGVVLLTFHVGDPSDNLATADDIHNWGGDLGANLADYFLEFLGLGALFLVVGVVMWGWTYFRHHVLPHKGVRALALGAGILCLSIGLSGFPVPKAWPLAAPLGGALGQILFHFFNDVVFSLGNLFQMQFPRFLTSLLFLGLSVPLCFYGAYLNLSLINEFLDRLAQGLARVLRLVSALFPKKNAPLDPPLEQEKQTPTFQEAILKVVPGARREPKPEPLPEPVRAPSPHPMAEAPEPAPVATFKKIKEPAPKPLELSSGLEYELPPLDLLAMPSESQFRRYSQAELDEKSEQLLNVLDDFGVKGDITGVYPGPVVTLYEMVPAPGTKSSRIIGLADDIARSMSAISARVSVIPGRNAIGIELPNEKRETVFLREMLATPFFTESPGKLALALGKDIGGNPIVADLAKMPHLLVAGTTGSGKSVAINTMILSLLYRLTPEECKLIMIDPKMLELSVYDGIPHLLSPVVTDPKKAIVALKWVVREMETRYRNMSQLGVRNIDGYNARLREAADSGEGLTRRIQTGFDPETGKPIFEEQKTDTTPIPYIVVIVDEMADLMMVAGKDIEAAVQRLAQMARAAGIHIIMATQRPSVDVITGTIKANFPTRISFQVTSRIDSRTILGEQGAEQLLGQGDMLYMASGGRTTRVHGGFVADREVEKIVKHLKDQGVPSYMDDITQDDGEGSGSFGEEDGDGSGDDLYDRALALIARERKASTSFIQRHLQIGYNRAARIMDQMEQNGVIGQANHVGKREILLPESRD